MERVCAWRVTNENKVWQMKKKLKEIRDSWICEKICLKAVKSVSGKWILLKFVRETWTKSPYLPSKVTLAQSFSSFCVITKRRNDPQPPRKIQQPPTKNRINANIEKATSVKNKQDDNTSRKWNSRGEQNSNSPWNLTLHGPLAKIYNYGLR